MSVSSLTDVAVETSLLYVTVNGTVHWIYNGKEDEILVKFMGKGQDTFIFSSPQR
jgi:hypothetical protein